MPFHHHLALPTVLPNAVKASGNCCLVWRSQCFKLAVDFHFCIWLCRQMWCSLIFFVSYSFRFQSVQKHGLHKDLFFATGLPYEAELPSWKSVVPIAWRLFFPFSAFITILVERVAPSCSTLLVDAILAKHASRPHNLHPSLSSWVCSALVC